MSSREPTDYDSVQKPRHYNVCGDHDGEGRSIYEPIRVIEAWGFGEGFCAGNAIKYILRAQHKGKEREDLEKALWYLDRLLDNPERRTFVRRTRGCDQCNPRKVAGAWNLTGIRQELAKVIEYIANGVYGSASLELRAYLGYQRMAKEIAEEIDREILADLQKQLGDDQE